MRTVEESLQERDQHCVKTLRQNQAVIFQEHLPESRGNRVVPVGRVTRDN